MQFNNLQKQYEQIKSNIQSGIHRVLEHGQYILGPEVQELENKLAAWVGVKHCVTVANGTDALMIALMALGIKPGDEVITTPFTFIANAEMIALLGATPVFVDIDPRTYNIDASKIEAAITAKTRCIMPVGLYGQCSDMTAINAIAERYQLPVIEDAAQSFGATHHQKKSCGLSKIGCTSFFPSRPLGCYGDGGACFTDDDELAKMMRQIRVHGQSQRYHHTILGMNSRLDTIQAAILLAKLDIFDQEVEQRIRIGQRYTNLLKTHAKTQMILSDNTCVYAQYTIEVTHRDTVQTYLKQKNIPTAIHYPAPLHLQPVFANQIRGASCPHAEHAAKHVISLPMDAWLTEVEQDEIVREVVNAIEVSATKETHALA